MPCKTLKAFTFSDYHIGQRNSRYDELEPETMAAIEAADIIVMTGDIIEMFYPKQIALSKNRIGVYEEAAEEGAAWLTNLLKQFPHKQFFYLEGNHENCDLYREKIYEIRKSQLPFGEGNLIWGRTYMHIGDGWFFHGDNEIRGHPVEKRDKRTLKRDNVRIFYEQTNSTLEAPAMEAMRLINSDRRIISKIHDFVQRTSPERLETANHAFFGHTHLPINGKEMFGIKWWNTGSAAKFGKDNAQTFDLVVPEESPFRTNDKRVFYPGATIENVQRRDLGGKYTERLVKGVDKEVGGYRR